MKNTICIDFDGTIHQTPTGYVKGVVNGEPVENAVYTLNNLKEAGYDLVLLSCRKKSEYPAMRQWLKKHNFPEMHLTNKKVEARAYIDNRAIRFTRWNDLAYLFL